MVVRPAMMCYVLFGDGGTDKNTEGQAGCGRPLEKGVSRMDKIRYEYISATVVWRQS